MTRSENNASYADPFFSRMKNSAAGDELRRRGWSGRPAGGRVSVLPSQGRVEVAYRAGRFEKPFATNVDQFCKPNAFFEPWLAAQSFTTEIAKRSSRSVVCLADADASLGWGTVRRADAKRRRAPERLHVRRDQRQTSSTPFLPEMIVEGRRLPQ